ncbi:MAG: metalloregulator ArsR/SmtB family transcription factor [Endomicrobia bacterium]|nr:metalloregulator ArsR/SmtB family transcription factor [Endomicrobiia bacterium]MCL2506155.1 metalloregulator ArsR/SmtB family transcription factor [Endomicrobiia bacterium]
MNTKYSENAKIFKALCDETRLMVLELLQSGEKCACVLLEKVDVGQSTLSHHMKILCDGGIVKGRKEGKWTHYSINKKSADAAKKLLEQLTKASFPAKNKNCKCE